MNTVMNMIVAVDNNWAIGNHNELLVSIPADMKFFRQETDGKVVVMGRKTLESFPNGMPLVNRVNIVLTDIGWDAVKGRRERMLKGVVAYLERLGEEDTENLLRILEKTRTIIMKENNDMKGKQ